MHEYGVALNLIEVLKNELTDYDPREVEQVFVKIGIFSGVHLDQLQFNLDLVKEESPFSATEFVLEQIEADFMCRDCGHRWSPEDYLVSCPECKGHGIDRLAGMELLIDSISLAGNDGEEDGAD